MYLWCQAYAGAPLKYNFTWGPPWFILWLLNFSIIYAVGAQFLPKLQFNMPHPLLLTAGVGPVLCGIFFGMQVALDSRTPQSGPYNWLGGMNQWYYGLGLYIPFFLAGMGGGRNDWLKNIEEMKTWVVWTLRVIVVGFWVLQFLSIAILTFPIPAIQNFNFLLFNELFPPFYAIPMTLTLMQFLSVFQWNAAELADAQCWHCCVCGLCHPSTDLLRIHDCFCANPQDRRCPHCVLRSYLLHCWSRWAAHLSP